MTLSSAFVFLSTLFSTTYAAIGPTGGLEIANANIAPDGFTRSAVLAGGTFPGPLIKANKGDTFSINVMDDLTDNTMVTSTSIHWHGIFQEGTNWEDGPAFVTQCPILPKNSFLYNFKVPHLSTQYCDGLRGPLVIYDPNDPQKNLYDVDDETTIITLSDWYHYPSPVHPNVPIFNSTLINGLGRYAGGPLSKLAVISVVEGKRYRFRLISMSCDPNWIFRYFLPYIGVPKIYSALEYSIEGHQFQIIEVDGVAHQPLTVDSIQIFAGQRYSFVLTANQKVDNYWIKAAPQFPGANQGFVNATNSAILRYAGAPVADPTTDPSANSTSTLPLVETALHPLVNTPVPGQPHPGGADVVLNLQITLNTTDFRFAINNVSFVPPTAPVLLQILSGTQAAQDLLPKGSVIELPANKVIEADLPVLRTPFTYTACVSLAYAGLCDKLISPQHNFHVIRSAGNSSYNFVNPVIRDVVSTGPSTSDLTTFRFETNNAGPWFLHCHIDWHLDIGLAVVFAENIPQIAQEKPPAAWSNLCPLYDASLQKQRSPGKPGKPEKCNY
ncbi:Laccase I [Mycena sanguinolenta]|uniref:Laccase I n=1 Tax=Mycena sanguinolenta TaxID=230812 RepID=A0A8H6YSZ2_9AGAR|nr:Laccase I [Mycena sanguinolenta]